MVFVQLLDQLEQAMRDAELWGEEAPTSEALHSELPFCVDTLLFEQWLQWVFIPKLIELDREEKALPRVSSVAPMAEEAVQFKEAQAVIDALRNIDAYISIPKSL